ncbi:MAG: SDR family oxidoreductase, partial [Spirochaetaceae bacterium]|nr:SDR family oxidoreductase [Spirochaetaceae bacterium]
MSYTRSDLFLVTGASSGIGLATALSLIAEGARVIGVGRDKARLIAAFGDQAEGDSLIPEEKDLTEEPARAAQWLVELARRHGKLRGMVLCAGARQTIPLKAISFESSNKLFALNYFSPIQLIKGFSNPLVSAEGDPSVVVVSSIAAQRPNKGL